MLKNTTSDVARALSMTKRICDADPFRAQVSGMRRFYVAALCILKSAETGKGVGLVPRHLRVVTDFHWACDDLTGNVRTISFACQKAARAVGAVDVVGR